MRRADPWLADDVVSDVFLVCWRRIDDVPHDALPWLLGVARRALSTRQRSGRRREALSNRLVAHADVAAAPIDHHDGGLRQALQSLSDGDRELLTLTAWEELTPRQIASVTGAKAATVRVRLLRARRRLDTALAAMDVERSSARPRTPVTKPSEET
jgi:RNA polymerase sigma-70 factor (ECF subfamily)